MKKSNALFAFLALFAFKAYAQPSFPAANPTANKANVISLWGNTYTNVSGTDWFPGWGQSTQVAYSNVGGDTTINYSTLNYEGVAFSSPINITNMDSIHFDIWTPNCTSLDIRLINSAAVSGTGSPIQPNVTVALKINTWNSVTIAVPMFTGLKLAFLDQMSFTALTPATGGSIYLENIYFSSHVNLPTIKGFVIPSNVLVGAAPFTITPPTSNSQGAFTYTSSDTTVATISGNVVTIVGAGTTVITANQAAAGSYSSGSASGTLVVSYAPPTTRSQMPNKPAANVISLWGNQYTNIAGINFRPDWGQSTQISYLSAGGDTTLKYYSLNYEGIQLANALNVSKAGSLHLDIWTPNCTSIGVNLINSAIVTGGAAVQVADTINLTKSGWNSIDIPLSAFSPVDLTKVDQLMFTGVVPALGGVIYLQNVYFWSNTTLPVTLANIKAVKNGTTALISWETLAENNYKGFEVQHSVDGAHWTAVEFLNSTDNSTTVNNYSFVDKNPTKGVNYYRLAETDLNGKVVYSSIVSVNFSTVGLGFTFYPNPVRNRLSINLQTIHNNGASVSLVGINGETLKTINLTNGNSNGTVSMDVSNVERGTYFLTLKDGDTISTNKVVVE